MNRLLLGAFLAALCPVATVAQTPWDPVNLVSQAQYTEYQLRIQNSGLGQYGGATYNQGYRNRYNSGGSTTESLGFKEANLYLKDRLAGFGLGVTEQSDYRNIIAELPGTQNPERIWIVSGHYDHPEANFDAPGGDDNASGTAGMLEAARVLSQYRFRDTIRFIGWGGEEGWMLGSWDYVNNVVKAGNQNVVGVLNLDMILRPGWDSNPNAPRDLDITTGDNPLCMNLAQDYMAAMQTYAPAILMDPRNPQTENWYPSDQGPFIQEGYAGLMIAENTASEIWSGQANWYYHTSNDASDRAANDPNGGSGVTYEYDFATNVVRGTVGFLGENAGLQPVPEPASLAVLGLGAMALLRRRRSR